MSYKFNYLGEDKGNKYFGVIKDNNTYHYLIDCDGVLKRTSYLAGLNTNTTKYEAFGKGIIVPSTSTTVSAYDGYLLWKELFDNSVTLEGLGSVKDLRPMEIISNSIKIDFGHHEPHYIERTNPTKKVTCVECLGEGCITGRGVWGMDTSYTCHTCDGTGYISLDEIKIPIEEYEKEYNEKYEMIGSKAYKSFKIIEN